MAAPDDPTAPAPGTRGAPRRARLTWPVLLVWAALGTAFGTAMVLIDLRNTGDVSGKLIHTGPTGPAAELLARDFPDEPQYTNGEHDGPMFYAFAKNPGDLDRVAESLDRPRYRLQRPIYPLAAWLLYPTGTGGDGLVRSMFLVNVLAAFGGGLALGALSQTLRGPPWVGVLYGVLPGVLTGWRISVADGLAVALMLGATVLFVRERVGWATVLAVLAILTKEPVALTFVGLALWRRDRRSVPFVVVPAVVAGAWQLYLRSRFAASGQDVQEFGVPFAGLIESWRLFWRAGGQALALVSFVLTVALLVVALIRHSPAHPLFWAMVVNAVALMPLTVTVLGLDRNGPRAVLPLQVLVLVAALSPGSPRPSAISGSP